MYNVIKRVFTFSVVATTIMWSVGIAALIPSVAQGATCPTMVSGDMIKVTGKPAIYAVNNDLKVLYFPSGDEFKSWRPTYGGYISITQECFDSLSVPSAYPAAVNYHPGSYLVKRPSSDQLYVVEPSNTLAKITSALATTLYGTSAYTGGVGAKVMTVADVFWPHYVNRGADITTATVHPGMLVKVSGTTYYIDSDNTLRTVTDTGFTANGFQQRFVRTVAASAISGLTAGATIDAQIPAVVDKTQSGGVTGGQTTNFTVSLASDNPAGANIPELATGVPMLKFVINGTGTINEIVVKRGGVGQSTDFDSVYLYNGNTRLTNARTVTSDTNTVTFTNLNLTAPVTLTVEADVSNTAGSNTDNFSVIKVNSDTVNVAGNYFSFNGNVSASAVTVDNIGGNWEVTLGTSQAEVAKFKIQSGVNDVTVSRITLRQGGALANTNLKNLKLFVGSTQVGTADALTGDKAILNFTVPYSIPKSQTKNFTLYADITGGRTVDNIKFYIDEKSDVAVMDVLYGVGAGVTNSFALGDQIVSMAGGQITLASNGPAATTYSVNTTNNDLFKLSLSSERNITIKKVKIWIATSSAFTLADASKVKNIKLVDLDSGNTLVGPIADLSAMTGSATGYWKEMSDSFDVSAGATRHLAIRADFDTALTDASIVKATFDLSGTNYTYDNDSAEYISNTKIVPSSVAGNNITASQSSLTVTKTATPANNTAVRGTKQVDALGINFAAGTADSLKLNKVVLYVYADANTTFAPTTGDTAANLFAEAVSLWDGTTQVGTLKSLSLVDGNSNSTWDSGEKFKAEFTNLNFALAAGTQKKLVAKLDLRNTYTGNYYLAVDLAKADLEVENSAGNLLTSITGNANLNLLATPVPYVLAKQSGTLTISVDGTTPKADIAVTGNTGISMTKYKLHATDESFTVVGARIVDDNQTKDVNLNKVVLEYKDANGNTVTKDGYLSGGALTFSDGQLAIPVAINQDSYVTIKADMNTDTGGAVTGNTIMLGFEKASSSVQWGTTTTVNNNLSDMFIALGDNSNKKLYGNADAFPMDHSSITAQTVAKTKVTAVNNMADGTSSQQNANKVGVFAFTSAAEPASNQKSLLKAVTVQLSGSLILTGSDGNVVVSLYNGSTYDSAHLMGTTTITGVDAGTSNAVVCSTTVNNEFDGTVNVNVVVNTNDADFGGAAGSNKTLGVIISNFGWFDGNNDSVLAVQPVTGLPITGGNLTYSL